MCELKYNLKEYHSNNLFSRGKKSKNGTQNRHRTPLSQKKNRFMIEQIVKEERFLNEDAMSVFLEDHARELLKTAVRLIIKKQKNRFCFNTFNSCTQR